MSKQGKSWFWCIKYKGWKFNHITLDHVKKRESNPTNNHISSAIGGNKTVDSPPSNINANIVGIPSDEKEVSLNFAQLVFQGFQKGSDI